MSYMTKKGGRTTSGLVASGVATINLHQRLSLSRRAVAKGSLSGDWKAVGCDIASAMQNVKRDR